MLTLRSAGPSVVTSLPSMMICPLVGDSKPAIMRKVVVLPQPDGPKMVVKLPLGISNEMLSTAKDAALSVPYRLLIFLNSTPLFIVFS